MQVHTTCVQIERERCTEFCAAVALASFQASYITYLVGLCDFSLEGGPLSKFSQAVSGGHSQRQNCHKHGRPPYCKHAQAGVCDKGHPQNHLGKGTAAPAPNHTIGDAETEGCLLAATLPERCSNALGSSLPLILWAPPEDGEAVVPSNSGYDPKVHLNWEDV